MPTWLSNKVLFLQKKKPQLVLNIGKHRARWKLETVPPWKLEIVPLLGAKSYPWGGTVNISPVLQFLTFILLVAAVKNEISKNDGTVSNSPKCKKVVQKMTLRHVYIYIYIYTHWWCYKRPSSTAVYELIRGPAFCLVPRNGACQELVRGLGQELIRGPADPLKKPWFYRAAINSSPGRSLSLQIRSFAFISDWPMLCWLLGCFSLFFLSWKWCFLTLKALRGPWALLHMAAGIIMSEGR